MADDPINDVVSSEDDDDDDDVNDIEIETEQQQQQQQSLNDVVSPSPSPPPSTATANTPPPPPPTTYTSVTVALATPDRKPIDDSRRLFQRLWTDEDEIELLQGYLDYTAARGGGSGGHHHDTTAFYDLIKNKLQLEFNKNQLVEKLRRLKKKYRNVISKMSSGKDFVFKSPHDHATFEISRKIWSNLSANVEFDDDHSSNPNLTASGGGLIKLSASRKRLRDDKFVKIEGDNNSINNDISNNSSKINVVANDNVTNVGMSTPLQVLIEETIKNCLSPVLKDLVNSTVNAVGAGGGVGGGGGSPRFKGVGELALNAVPLNFTGVNVEDEKWRKQQIIELEVYSKRLELVQEQIKLALDELKSIS